MSDLLLGGMLPRRWSWEPPEWFVSEIILNWLEIEIDVHAYISMPILIQIHGYRRREIVHYFDDTKNRRDFELTHLVYGYPGAMI